MQEVTFSMIKPDAVTRNLIGAIVQKLEDGGLKVKAARLIYMSVDLCEVFYQEHKDKPFFSSFVNYMSSGPVFVMALSGNDAVRKVRKIIGHTDPAQAEMNTIRALYGESIERNSIHGSESLSSAERELNLLFTQYEWKQSG